MRAKKLPTKKKEEPTKDPDDSNDDGASSGSGTDLKDISGHTQST